MTAGLREDESQLKLLLATATPFATLEKNLPSLEWLMTQMTSTDRRAMLQRGVDTETIISCAKKYLVSCVFINASRDTNLDEAESSMC